MLSMDHILMILGNELWRMEKSCLHVPLHYQCIVTANLSEKTHAMN